jgi:hypothetical protein
MKPTNGITLPASFVVTVSPAGAEILPTAASGFLRRREMDWPRGPLGLRRNVYRHRTGSCAVVSIWPAHRTTITGIDAVPRRL